MHPGDAATSPANIASDMESTRAEYKVAAHAHRQTTSAAAIAVIREAVRRCVVAVTTPMPPPERTPSRSGNSALERLKTIS